MLDVFTNIRLLDLIDIGIVAFIIYRIILLIKGTRAVQMLLGLAVILAVYMASRVGDLHTLNWFLSNFLSSIILVIVVIFQNDIRRALMHVGRNPFLANTSRDESEIIDELVKACVALGNRKIGALIAIERETGINDILESGTQIDARVSCELIRSIFMPSSPIHDGALVLQQGRLTMAGCFLPLSQGSDVTKELGTRHRAAIGLTELADAVAIIVSEETGKISVAVNGGMTRNLDAASLKRSWAVCWNPASETQEEEKEGGCLMFRLVTENWSLKLISLVFALLLWMFIMGERQLEVGYLVPLELQNIPKGLMVANEVPSQVDVRVSGPRTLLMKVSPNDISIIVDLNDLRPGLTTFKRLEERLNLPSGLRVTRLSPSFIDLKLERIKQKQVPVKITLEGEPLPGYQIGRIMAVPDQVLLRAVRLN